MKAAKRPRSIVIGKVRVRVQRGPREDGRWYWRADRQAGAKREQLWSGWGSRDEAEAEVLRVLGAGPDADGPAEARTVLDLLEYWCGAVSTAEDIQPATRIACLTAAKRLKAGIGHVHIARMDRAAIAGYRDTALRAGRGASTVARDLKYLRQAWRWGREVAIVPQVDLPTVRVESAGKDRVYTDYTPTREEVGRLINAAEGWLQRLLLLAWATGARVGELSRARWGDLAADGSTLTLGAHAGARKTGTRTVPLAPAVRAQVAAWSRGAADASLFGADPRSTEARTRTLLGRLSGALALGGRVTPHGIRRAAVDALYDRGVDPAVAAALLGHSPATALAHYRTVKDRAKLDAVAALDVDVVTGGVVLPFGRRT